MPSSTQEPIVLEAIECFATDEVKKVNLPGTPYWVEVKRHLEAGEAGDMEAALFENVSLADIQAAVQDGDPSRVTHLNFSKRRFLNLALFVDDWNLRDKDGKTVRLPRKLDERVAVMRRLSVRMAALVQAAVEEVSGEELKALNADPDDDANPTPGESKSG